MASDRVETNTSRFKATNPLPTAETAGKNSPTRARLNSSSPESTELEGDTPPAAFTPTFRVYAIVVGLGITNLLAALENTVVAIAAPVILTDLQLGDNFIWITNAFFLCRYVFSSGPGPPLY